MPLIPLEEAQATVLDAVPVMPEAMASLGGTWRGLVLAQPLVATKNVPEWPNSAMDGFAVRAADTAGAPIRLKITGTAAAGAADSALTVGAGEAVRIMTGAVVPSGADAVVMVERTRVDGDEVVIEEAAPVGQFIRPAGDDVRAGTTVAEVGTPVTPGVFALAATLGYPAVPVRQPPSVMVLSTGDELLDPPSHRRTGQIYDSNRPALIAAVQEAGARAVNGGIVADREDATVAAFEAAIANHDAVISTGGVSMGDFDHVKRYLSTWMQVAIKPAKPFAFGVVDGTPVFGLPGNPVSSLVSFELFVRPALRKMQGFPEAAWHRPVRQAVAGDGLARRPDGKLHLVRVVVEWRDGRYHARSAGGQGSHQLHAMASANGLALLPDGTGARNGETVDVLLLDAD